MIALEGVSARRAPLALSNVSLAFGPGVHSILGGRDDGGPLLLALVAGAARARSGRIRVLDRAPDDPRARASVAWVPLPASLPDGLRVREVLRLAETLRGDARQVPEERLSALGVGWLADRPVASLSRAEARTVALAEAITSPNVRVLLLEEPLLGVDPRAVAFLAPALRARGREGCAVIIATGSAEDAGQLADDHTILRAGKALGPAVSLEALLGLGSDGARLYLVAPSAGEARRLLAALTGADADGSFEALEQDGAAIQARGRDPVAMARAIARAAAGAHVDVVDLRCGAPSLDAVATALGVSPPPLPAIAPPPIVDEAPRPSRVEDAPQPPGTPP